MRRRILGLCCALFLSGLVGAGVGARPAGAVASRDLPSASAYWLADASGHVWSFGQTTSYGSAGGLSLASPIVDIEPTPDDGGYWLAGADGGIFTFGDATYQGSAGALRLAQPIVAMVPTSDGAGYWLVARDGGVFTFGDATYHGSTGALRLAQPIVGMVPTPDDGGYWLVARDGGVFTFGDAAYEGSTGRMRLSAPIVAMAATGDDAGYWLLAADGGVFSFGDAAYAGSLGGTGTLEPAERIVASSDSGGYWIVEQNGTAVSYGDATGAPPAQALMFRAATPGDRAVLFAFAQLGKPYIWGGNGPVGYDCSGLALASWRHGAGVSFARVADDQYHTAGPSVPLTGLVAGDLVFWGSDATNWTSVYHAAMYVGGGQIVEATGDHVQLNRLVQWGAGDLMPHGVRP